MGASRQLTSRGLKYKLCIGYFLMFILPVAYLLYIIWELTSRQAFFTVAPEFVSYSIQIGIPAAVVMSLASFLLVYRSLASLETASQSMENFALQIHNPTERPQVEGDDEAAKISYYVTDMITEFRQKLTDVDRFAQELHEANQKLVELAINDGLTGLYHQKQIKRVLSLEMERARRFNHPLSILMLDLDHFKEFNDTHGHTAGDKALILVAHVIRASVRAVDIPARYGGEEFLIVLPETDGPAAIRVAERIRQEIAAAQVDTGEKAGHVRITASLGVGVLSENSATAEDFISDADRHLYEAKAAGRNCVRA